MGATQSDGRTSATYMAMPYDYFQTFPAASYGLSYVSDATTLTLTEKALTLTLMFNLTRDLSFTFLDPLGTGVYILEGVQDGLNKKLYVWQVSSIHNIYSSLR
jgi:hypothetical protein